MRKAKQFLGVMLAIMMVFGYLLPLTAEASAVDCSGFECEDHEHHDHDVLEQCDGDHTECGEHDECDLIDCADCSDDAHCDCEEGFASSSSTSKSILKQQAACNHTYAWVNTKNPTCTAKGTKQYRCTKCNAQYYNSPTLSVDALGHNWTTVTTKQPTCGTSGTYVTKCSRCGAGSQNGNGYISATGKHNWVLTGTTNATCTANGAKNYKCSVCGQTKSDTLNALGHNWDRSEATCTAPKKCTRCGTVAQNALGHSWDRSAATCTAGQKCTRCGAGGQAALGHNWNRSAATCTDAKSCTRCGTVAESAKGHSWDRTSATCTVAKKCTRCGTVGQSPLGHNWNRTAATCTEAKVCTRCNTTGENAKGHSWDRTSATCTADKKCKTCGAVGEKALGHNYQQVTTLNPTCGAQGTYVTKCTRCGTGAQNGNGYISPTGQHKWVLTSTINATCTAEGSKVYTCSVCAQKKTESIAKTAHNYQWVVTKNATCTEEGVKSSKCTACDAVSQTQKIEKVAHAWNLTSATCTTDKKCNVCGAVGEKALGHNYKTETTKQPTCGEQGIYVTKCTRCGAGAQNGNGYITPTGNHKWDIEKATCTRGQKCTVCGADGEQAKGHRWNPAEEICTKGKYCLDCEYEEQKATGHVYSKEATCTEAKICDKCHYIAQEALGHKWKTILTAVGVSSSNSRGSYEKSMSGRNRVGASSLDSLSGKKFECEHCQKTADFSEIQANDDHNWIVDEEVPATCTESGYTHYHCSECGDTLTDTIPMLGHTITMRVKEGEAPSCAGSGTAELFCAACNTIVGYRSIQYYGDHSWVRDASQSTDEYDFYTCSNPICNATKTLDHDYKWVSIKEAHDCISGEAGYKCINPGCGDITAWQSIQPYGDHKWKVIGTVGSPTNGYPALCFHGTAIFECENCGITKREAFDGLEEHQWQLYKVVKLPSLSEKGEEIWSCRKCATHETRDTYIDIQVTYRVEGNDLEPVIYHFSSEHLAEFESLGMTPPQDQRFDGWRVVAGVKQTIFDFHNTIIEVLIENHLYKENEPIAFTLEAVFSDASSVDDVNYIQVIGPKGEILYGMSQSVITKDDLRQILRELIAEEMVKPIPDPKLSYEIFLAGSIDDVVEGRLNIIDGGICGIEVAINEYLYLSKKGQIVSHEEILQLVKEYFIMFDSQFDWLERRFTGGEAWYHIARFLNEKTEYRTSGLITVSTFAQLCDEFDTGLFNDSENEYEKIVDMLNNDIPVIMSYENKKAPLSFYEYSCFSGDKDYVVARDDIDSHFWVVTGIELDKNGKRYLKVASWGETYYVSWDEYVDRCGNSIHDDVGTGVLYLNPKKK